MKMKKILAGIIAAVLVVAGVFVTPAGETKAAEVTVPTTGVTYESRTVDGKVPTKDGYFFGGWYTDDKNANPSATAYTSETLSGVTTAYAKFVPAYVLSVKSQNLYGTAASNDNTGSTNTRFLSAVDSGEYNSVGFKIVNTANGKEKTLEAKKVYEKVYVKADDNSKYYTAVNLFGAGAAYVTVLEMGGIPETAWSNDFYIRPYWVTKDGTTVYGLGKYVRVGDGVGTDKYISVPVSLTTAQEVAAGLVTVTYDKDILDYAGYVKGRVFEEAIANETSDGIVKCAANVEDITTNSIADDMYIGLRFKVTDTSYKLGNNQFLQFKMSGVDFCNKDESTVNLNVWNFQY